MVAPWIIKKPKAAPAEPIVEAPPKTAPKQQPKRSKKKTTTKSDGK